MSWLNQFISWLSPTYRNQAKAEVGVKFDEKTNGLSSARAVLAAEQAELSREIEDLFLAYDEKVQNVALRVRDLPPDAAEEEIERLRAVQRDLRLVVRRLDAAIKTRQELERELSTWRNRSQDKEQARRRAEIIRSELAVRGGDVPEVELEQPIVIQDLVKDRPKKSLLAGIENEVDDLPQAETVELQEPLEPLRVPDVEHLLTAIREATREAERWHAIPVEDLDEEALIQVHHVKELNGLLKRLDRRQGIERDRLALAICPREYR